MKHLFAPTLLGLALMLSACDGGEEAKSSLPPASGEGAAERAEIPMPTTTADGAQAQETANHRWVGTVRAKQHVEMAPIMGGTISAINFDEGDTVKEGDVLFKISGSAVRHGVSQAAAAVAAAELQLSEAEREAERTRKLADRGSVGSANLDRANAGVDAAAAGVRQAKAAAAAARSRTGDLKVESPISGVVTMKLKSVGEVAMTMPPTIVLVIDNFETVEVRVRVPELKLREIDVGSEVTAHFPALDLARTVPITRIGNSVDPRTRTIELIIEVDNPELRIKPGMSVELELPRKDAPAEAAAEAPAEPEAAPDAQEGTAAASPTAMLDSQRKPG